MEQQVNEVYEDLFTKHPRYFILMGGRAAGRSTAASQFALSKLVAPEYFRCAMMRFVLGDIRNSIFQDIQDRIEEQELQETIEIRESPKMRFRYGQNKIDGIAFRKSSSEQKSKLKSLANYNTIIIEEADEVSEDDFNQLDDSIRTSKSQITIILLLNAPDKNHWIIKRWFNLVESDVEGFYRAELKPNQPDTIFISTDYRTNLENLDKGTIANYERYKEDKPDHYWNMIRGYVSEGRRGRIFTDWKICTDEEFEALPYPVIYGMDFGFTNDPAALVGVKIHNDKIWCRELFYETGLTNPMICKKLEQLGVKKSDPIFADCAEPKSIEEIKSEGWNIIPSMKGADSVRAGVNFLLDYIIHHTQSSENIALETQEYRWALDRNKEPTNEPIDAFNHLMDAIRYAVYTYLKIPVPGVYFGE